MKTWKLEALFVAGILYNVWIYTGAQPWELVGSLAVLFTFMHAQVGFRFTEEASDRFPEGHHVHCHRWMSRYFILKEILWFALFMHKAMWAALVGVGVFLLYPFWRKYHLARKKDDTKVKKFVEKLKAWDQKERERGCQPTP